MRENILVHNFAFNARCNNYSGAFSRTRFCFWFVPWWIIASFVLAAVLALVFLATRSGVPPRVLLLGIVVLALLVAPWFLALDRLTDEPLKLFNYDTNWLETGNPDLVQAEIESYDVRWEYYPALRSYAGVSFFYKDLTNPIEKIIDHDVANYQEKPINADTGLLRGYEVELRGHAIDSRITPSSIRGQENFIPSSRL